MAKTGKVKNRHIRVKRSYPQEKKTRRNEGNHAGKKSGRGVTNQMCYCGRRVEGERAAATSRSFSESLDARDGNIIRGPVFKGLVLQSSSLRLGLLNPSGKGKPRPFGRGIGPSNFYSRGMEITGHGGDKARHMHDGPTARIKMNKISEWNAKSSQGGL